MKKLLCIMLCLIMSMFVLAGCAEEDIGAFLENYPKIDDEVEELTINICIICEEGTQDLAKTTVVQKLTQYAKEDFNTTLEIDYYSEAEYKTKIDERLAADSTDVPDIILVNKASMLEELVAKDRVEDLTAFYDTNTYGKLNVAITQTILEKAKINDKLYCVPNNHVVGKYQYLLVDKAAARYFHYSDEAIAAMNSELLTAELKSQISSVFGEAAVSEKVKVVSGMYEDLEAYRAQGYHCNIISYPTVDKEEALSSSFAVVKGTKDPNRCMEIIYAINTVSKYRNTLQYGVEGANYTVDEATGVVTRTSTGENVYYMKKEYTGNVFTALPCDEINWTKAAITNGEAQNQESIDDIVVLYIICGEAITDKAKADVEAALSAYTKANFGVVLDIEFKKAADYLVAIDNATRVNSNKRADIILVNSESLAKNLVEKNALLDLTSFVYSNDYPEFTGKILSNLLTMAQIDGKLYTVPNEHVVGTYEYLQIDIEKATKLGYTKEHFATFTSMDDDIVKEFIAKIVAENKGDESSVAKYIKKVTGDYALRLENDKENAKYYFQPITPPVVTSLDALSTGFAISAYTDNLEECIKILYTLNTVPEFRNTLQYGIKDVNYTVDETTGLIKRVASGENLYTMDLKYTGSIFDAYYCEELKWTETTKTQGEIQNSESIILEQE